MTEHHPATPEGMIEQAGEIAHGIRLRRRGWQRLWFRAGVAVLALAALGVIVAVALR